MSNRDNPPFYTFEQGYTGDLGQASEQSPRPAAEQLQIVEHNLTVAQARGDSTFQLFLAQSSKALRNELEGGQQ